MRMAVIIALALAGPAAAQEAREERLREMATDRPNLTDSPTTIDAGHVQLEIGGIDRTTDRTELVRERSYSYGDVNARLGVAANVELNLIVQPHVVSRSRDRPTGATTSIHGLGDLVIGGKVNFWGNDGSDAPWATALAIKPQLKLPTAADGFGNGNAELTVALPFTMNLPAGFGLSLQPSLLRVRNAADRRYTTGYQAAVAIDHDVGPVNAYVEYVLDDTTEGGQSDQQLLDLGATAAVTDNLVLDVGLGIGLSEAADDLRLLIGGSVRF